MEEIVTAIDGDDAVFQLALPPVLGARDLLELRDDHIVALLILLVIATDIREIVFFLLFAFVVLLWII